MSRRGAPFITVHLQSAADILSASLDGQALDVSAGGPLALNVQFSNLRSTGIVVHQQLTRDASLTARLTDGSTGLTDDPGSRGAAEVI